MAEARKTESERDREQLQSDIEALMASGAGRRIAYRLLESSHVYQTCYRDNPLQMARAEGRREIGLMLTDWLSIYAWENYQLMLTEANNERRERDARQRANLPGGNPA
jgi:hypothetical protein|nr:MAG TPA: hypothetical protein [Caudoviricetes sp.]